MSIKPTTLICSRIYLIHNIHDMKTIWIIYHLRNIKTTFESSIIDCLKLEAVSSTRATLIDYLLLFKASNISQILHRLIATQNDTTFSIIETLTLTDKNQHLLTYSIQTRYLCHLMCYLFQVFMQAFNFFWLPFDFFYIYAILCSKFNAIPSRLPGISISPMWL